MEIYREPDVTERDRINGVLDFVFGKPSEQSSIERNRDTLRLLAEECSHYMARRNVKSADNIPLENPNATRNTDYMIPALQNGNQSTAHNVPPPNQTIDEYQGSFDWQPSLDFENNSDQFLAAPDMSNWTDPPPIQSNFGNSLSTMEGDYWADGLQLASGSF